MMLRIDCTPQQLASWRESPHAVPTTDVVLRVEGPGAVACLQGLFTNDVERAVPGSLLWGAVLTPKGMIITDLWLWRRQSDLLVIVPEPGANPLLELFRRSFPPRLARVHDLRGTLAVWWLTTVGPTVPAGVDLLQPGGPAPFAAIAIGPRETTTPEWTRAGWAAAPEMAAAALALLAGWPALGREIDPRTLVQEVRMDELQAVRYDKGCFVGQETVARLHFRGHPNRTLRAITGHGALPETAAVTSPDQRDVGSVATLLHCGEQWVASVKLRREVADGDRVLVGGRDAVVRDFPVELGQLI